MKGMGNSFAGMLNSILIHLAPFTWITLVLEIPTGKAKVCTRHCGAVPEAVGVSRAKKMFKKKTTIWFQITKRKLWSENDD